MPELVAERATTRDERRALEQRIAAAERQVAAEQRHAASDRDRRRRRLRTAEPTHLSPRRPMGRVVGRGRHRQLVVLGRRAARAEAAQAGTCRRRRRAQRLAEFDSVVALEVRQRLLEIDSGRAAVAAADDAVRAATEARRVVGRTIPRRRAFQTEVLDAEVALLQAELDRTRAIASVRLAEARLARALGR